MLKVAVCLVLCLMLATPVFGIDRDVDISAEGRVELNTVSYNEHLRTGMDVRGEGVVNLDNLSLLNADDFDQAYDLELASAEDTLRPLEGVTALLSEQATHALKVAPDTGDVATVGASYVHSVPAPADDAVEEAEEEEAEEIYSFSELDINAEAQVTGGELRTHVDIESLDAGVKEELRVEGEVYYADDITVDELHEVEIEVDELD